MAGVHHSLACCLLPILAACARTSEEAGGSTIGSALAAAQQVEAMTACAGAEHRSIDYLVGEWRVVETASGKDYAQNRVELVDGGCAIREHLRLRDGMVLGSNTIFFSPADQLWHTFYHDSMGFYAHLTGVANAAGRHELIGDVRFPAQPARMHKARQVTYADEAGRPRQVGYLMNADDVSWQVIYDLTFCPGNKSRADSTPPCRQ